MKKRKVRSRPKAKDRNREAAQLRILVSAVKEVKNLLASRKPIPRIGLRVDPPWCRENPGEAAEQITRLRDALMRTLAHCDAAKHKGNAYRDERDALVDALGPSR